MTSVPLFIVKHWKYILVAILAFSIGIKLQPSPPASKKSDSNISENVQKNKNLKSETVSKTKLKVKKKNGDEVEAEIDSTSISELIESISQDLKISEHIEEIAKPQPRFFGGPAVSSEFDSNKKEFKNINFGLSGAIRLDQTIYTISIFPKEQRGETSLLIPLPL